MPRATSWAHNPHPRLSTTDARHRGVANTPRTPFPSRSPSNTCTNGFLSAPTELLPARTCPAASTRPGNTVTPSLGTNSASFPRITSVAVALPSAPNPNPQTPSVVVTTPANRAPEPSPHPTTTAATITIPPGNPCPNAPNHIRIFLTVANLPKALSPTAPPLSPTHHANPWTSSLRGRLDEANQGHKPRSKPRNLAHVATNGSSQPLRSRVRGSPPHIANFISQT